MLCYHQSVYMADLTFCVICISVPSLCIFILYFTELPVSGEINGIIVYILRNFQLFLVPFPGEPPKKIFRLTVTRHG